MAEIELSKGSSALCRAARELQNGISQEKWYHRAQLSDGSYYLRWGGLFEFLISADGRRIGCRPLSDASPEAFHTYLLTQVLSFALIKQGIEPLHSTVIVIDGEAVGFLGDSGYGKSTLAATFVQAGHRLLTDDLLVVKDQGGGLLAFPGPPRIKLFPEIAKRLLGNGTAGTPMNNLTPKLIIPLDRDRSCRVPVPLRELYVLARPAAASRYRKMTISRLPQRRAFLALLKNTFNVAVTEAERLKRQFSFAAQVSVNIPIKLLSYPGSIESLPSVRETIISSLNH